MPPKAPPAKLNIVMYEPRRGNYEHWALHLEHEANNTIYEVVGEHPSFEKNSVSARPQASANLKRSFQVGTINTRDLPAAKQRNRQSKGGQSNRSLELPGLCD
ncbi:hypothetical protein PV05_03276 [Exophiala xenobiotica]|uniref:Uncharacterized protein n=1 Tax=Exophiala xenobiotica TaxID=348802 RepID=A0A0D2FF79_9EURO|nr:uncharacterized protein PV05_03276 [Exophiala xenobiotica]KIW58779.1 hypothetical protein PV05_03276 [Exophiala xenobiotica]